MKKETAREKEIIKWYQKNYLIDYRGQLRIILTLAGVTFVFTAVMCFISYEWILHLRPLFTQTIVGPSKPEESFAIIANILLWRLIGVMVLMNLFFILFGVILTHRLTGPIWKLRRELRKFFNGENIEVISFRNRDEFQDLPELINRLIKGYENRKAKEKK